MAIVFKGKAVFEGTHGTFDVIVYPVAQSQKLTQNWEQEDGKNAHGDDMYAVARNEHYLYDMGMKIVGDTKAHAAGAVAFLSPLSSVVVTDPGPESPAIPPIMLGTFQIVNGSEIDLGNTKVGDITFKLRKYADSTQNTLMNTTPS